MQTWGEHANSTQKGSSWQTDSEPGHSCGKAIVLTTEQLCPILFVPHVICNIYIA